MKLADLPRRVVRLLGDKTDYDPAVSPQQRYRETNRELERERSKRYRRERRAAA